MPTSENPAADAAEVETALRALAHATRSIDDPRQVYSVLGSLTSAVASLSQSLHQIAAFHDGPAKSGGWVAADSAQARSTSYRVSWELHRAGEVLHQASESISNAHEAEAVLRYHREFPEHGAHRTAAVDQGLSL
ncbi:MAG: hypothetical protein QM572_01130 [Nocardioides sp.]|uniref:hypothetical protein n=1 Tax=Nocardioides sp. TaxID=35761 RepID=UPI0039E71EBD